MARIVRSKKRITEEDIQESLGFDPQELDGLNRAELLELLAAANSDIPSIEDCRLYLYRPNHEVALRFHKSCASIRMNGGGNRSGKTQTAVVEVQILLTGIVPKSLKKVYPKEKLTHPQHWRIVSTDFPNGIDKVIIPMFVGPKAWIPQDLILHWDPKNRNLMLRNIYGSVSWVEFMSYEQDTAKFQGTSRNGVLYDEEPPQAIRDECKMRVVDVDGSEIFSMTPTNGMSWTYDEIYEKRGRECSFAHDAELEPTPVEKLISGEEINLLVGDSPLDVKHANKDADIHFFAFYSIHNPNIKTDRVKKEAAKMGEKERNMRIYGEFVSFTGKVFNNYSEKLHLVKKTFEIPQEWPRYVALDPHPRTPHAFLFVAVDPQGQRWIYDEIWTEPGCAYDDMGIHWYKHLYDQVPDNAKNKIPFDVKIINEKGFWRLAEPIKFQIPWIVRRIIDPSALIENPATKSTLVQDLLRMGMGNWIPGSKDLTRGILKVNTEFKENMVFVMPYLDRFRFEINRYVYEDWTIAKQKDRREQKQSPKDKDDHMMENIRRILVEDPIFIQRELYDKPQNYRDNY